MKAYKGFDKNMKCRGFQYREGETYHEDTAELCKRGFHACEMPLDVLGYYAPGDGSIYREVELEDVSQDRQNGDTKVCAKTIKIGAEIGIPGLVKAQIEYIKSRTAEESDGHATGIRGAASATGIQGTASATGIQGAASATGIQGTASATGIQGTASATGIQGAASATGIQGTASATGDQGAASATGDQGSASATGDRGAASATGIQGAASATGDRGAASATGNRGAASATGNRGAASATGDQGSASATGNRGSASATGNRGAASATGNQGAASATGKDCAAMACGICGRVMGGIGCALFAVERGLYDCTLGTYPIASVAAGIVDGDNIKPGVWYVCKGGKLVEVESNGNET